MPLDKAGLHEFYTKITGTEEDVADKAHLVVSSLQRLGFDVEGFRALRNIFDADPGAFASAMDLGGCRLFSNVQAVLRGRHADVLEYITLTHAFITDVCTDPGEGWQDLVAPALCALGRFGHDWHIAVPAVDILSRVLEDDATATCNVVYSALITTLQHCVQPEVELAVFRAVAHLWRRELVAPDVLLPSLSDAVMGAVVARCRDAELVTEALDLMVTMGVKPSEFNNFDLTDLLAMHPGNNDVAEHVAALTSTDDEQE